MNQEACISPDGLEADKSPEAEVVIQCRLNALHYGNFLAVRDTFIDIRKGQVTGFIGPSGCGKSSVLRCFNRTNDLVDGFSFDGQVVVHGTDIYHKSVDPVLVRRNIGMVFQQPNPFAMSIFDNVAFGLRLNKFRGDLEERVQDALVQAALWDEVKDKLKSSALALSGGQQQRLCIARAIATRPYVLLMDEPASALDPIATQRIEELMNSLKENYTIVLVTHNMQQALRVADTTAFMSVEIHEGGRTGFLVEHGATEQIFKAPKESLTREYVSGEFS